MTDLLSFEAAADAARVSTLSELLTDPDFEATLATQQAASKAGRFDCRLEDFVGFELQCPKVAEAIQLLLGVGEERGLQVNGLFIIPSGKRELETQSPVYLHLPSEISSRVTEQLALGEMALGDIEDAEAKMRALKDGEAPDLERFLRLIWRNP